MWWFKDDRWAATDDHLHKHVRQPSVITKSAQKTENPAPSPGSRTKRRKP
jgi:hypothetical protein